MNSKTSHSVKRRVLFTLIPTILMASILVGLFLYWGTSHLISNHIKQSELPYRVLQVRNALDRDVLFAKGLTTALALDTFLEEWLENGAPIEQEPILTNYLKRLADHYDIPIVAFADRETKKYWNQDGFLRVLQDDERDGWFYRLVESDQEESSSIYIEEDGTVHVFVNHQNIDGRTLGGVGFAFEDVIEYLAEFQFKESGFVFITDVNGDVKVHPKVAVNSGTTISDLHQGIDTSSLFVKQDFSYVEVGEMIVAAAYVPSLEWYVIAQVPKQELFSVIVSSRNQVLLVVACLSLLFVLLSLWLSRRLSSPIDKLAYHDPLTHCYNRHALKAELSDPQHLALKQTQGFSVILIDLDHFKSINDQYGHDIGDEVLKWFAGSLNESIRTSDSLFRYGGEEFLILCNGTKEQGAKILSEKLHKSLAKLTPPHGHAVTFSAGIAQLDKNESSENWIARADKSLYHAKQNGRNQSKVASELLET
ncbi:diguanylate cyclase [Vibrio sp. SCSIO 43136]|uniref:diguanylate cyclase n=1 Tax=Vibrio sp. SCSIO 43136 TaxID=2819101 RepID=UPI002075DF3C|nr:diguanylate cyclase [Vibrio sp. SCSIO 43136]USD64963.1 diguanylate cyclase [Vibrio sp. SCSIO 43136]